MTYISYTDESYISAERYRSICSFSFPASYEEEVNIILESILKESGVKEFKWEKLRSAKYRFCAQKIVDFVFNNIRRYDIRLDILIWDTYDSRHKIANRDDIANFERMFFHLMRSSMTRREQNATWTIKPDERLDIDWHTIKKCLKSVGEWKQHKVYPLIGSFFKEQYYKIDDFTPIESHQEPCCQVADLFAGISVFSKSNYSTYEIWEKQNSHVLELFEREDQNFSNSESERFKIVMHIINRCNKDRLGVSIKSNRCLTTFNPNNPVNFWHYCPQHDQDKAPIKTN